MSRQSRLVQLLILSVGVFQLSLCNKIHSSHIVLHDDILDNQLESDEIFTGEKQHIKISTPKAKSAAPLSTTSTSEKSHSIVEGASTTPVSVSDDMLDDLVEASKHSKALADDDRFKELLAKKLNSTTTTAQRIDDIYDDDYDSYDDYEYGLNNDQSTTVANKKGGKNKEKLSKKPIEMKPIKEDIKTSTVKAAGEDNKESNNIEFHNDNTVNDDEEDDEDEDDDYDDDEDDEFENDNDIKDEEEVVFSKNMPCPRYCTCERNVNSYLVAYCSRIDPGTQKFGTDITDLVVTDVGPKYPILLGPDFFLELGLKHVSSIKIANCTIEYLHPDAFNGLDDLFSVNFTNVGLAIINPDTFAKNKKLRLLTISGNDLSVMSSVHYLLKSSSIEELDLSRNNLMELNPNAFSELTNIVYINLSQNNLAKIPEGVFDKLETIEELDLSYNSLKTLPANIFNRTTLAILQLKYNSITNDLKFGTPDLQQLDLSFNQIHIVHHGMFDKMTSLTNLNLKGNGLTKVQPDSFMTLKNLRNIDLSINELDQMSSMMFFKNSELDVIRLNDNPRLSQLPTDGFRSYNGYFTVYYLDVSNCAIGALGHKTFSTMPHLSILKLAWNNINNLERDTFASLKKLIDLDLSNNLIARLDELIFMNNNDLTKLNLAGNPIRRLSVRLFLPLVKLRELDVSDCELNSLLSDNQYGVGRKYKFYESLKSFNASANQIHKIHSNDVRNFKNLRSLDVSHNPLKCNENFQDFISYVSLNHQLMPHAMPLLGNLEAVDTQQLEIESQAGWASFAHEVCKHQEFAHNKKNSVSASKIEKRLQKFDKDLDEDAKNLLNIMENNKLQKILKDSHHTQVVVHDDDINNAEDEKDDAEDDYDDEEEENSEDDDDEDEENDNADDEENDNTNSNHDVYDDYEKKAEISKKIIDHGIRVQEIDLSKETDDRFLLDKFIADRKKLLEHKDDDEEEDDEEDSEDNDEEYIIERGHIYYSGDRFLLPIIITITCAIVLLLVIAKVIMMVMRKRGERYRMSLLQAHTNSIVYQKLTEDIKPPKEPKQPKVHQYTPINQV